MANTTCPQCGAALSAEWATPTGEVWCRACRAHVPLDAAATEDASPGINWTRVLRPSAKKASARQPEARESEESAGNLKTVASQASPEQPHAQDTQPSQETPETPVNVPDRSLRRLLRWLFPKSPQPAEVLPDTVLETGPDPSPATGEEVQEASPDAKAGPAPETAAHSVVAGRLLADLTQARARAVWQDRALDEVRARCETLAGVIGKLTDDLNHERAERARLDDALQEALLDAEQARDEAAQRGVTSQTNTALAVRPEVMGPQRPGARDDMLEALMRFTSGRNSGGR